MTPVFSTDFKVTDKIVRVTDLFDYASILFTVAYGNFTAKIGNSIFHQNTNFNSSADLVIPGNIFKEFNLPTSDGKVQSGGYQFTETVQIVDEVLYRPSGQGFLGIDAISSTPFSSVTITSVPTGFQAAVQAVLDSHDDVRIIFYDSFSAQLTETTLTGVTSDSLTFASFAYAGYADVVFVRIMGTNFYTTTNNYSFDSCDEVTPSINVTTDCYKSQLTVQDTTPYPAYVDTLTREVTIQYPTKNGSQVLPPVISSTASTTIGPNIWTGGYTISMINTLVWDQDDDLIITQVITLYSYPNVICDAGLCKLLACIESFRMKYMLAIKNGARNIAELTQQNLTILLFCNSYNIAVQCGDTTYAATLLAEFIAYMGYQSSDSACNCGCTDSGSGNTEPTEIYPFYSQP